MAQGKFAAITSSLLARKGEAAPWLEFAEPSRAAVIILTVPPPKASACLQRVRTATAAQLLQYMAAIPDGSERLTATPAICSPCKTSHVKMSANERLKLGISDKLLRLSVGIEDADDLIDDIRQAL